MTTLIEKTAGLLAFVRSVETGSFSSAARSLGATPSAISKSVAKLEARLGARLLHRSTRSISLTDEGASYYERVTHLVRELEEAEDAVLVREGGDVAVRVGPLADSALMARTIGHVEFAACAAPSYLRAHGAPISLEDLARHKCLRYLSGGQPLDWEFVDGGARKTVTVSGSFDTDDGGALVAATLSGGGIARVFRFQVEAHFASGELVPVLERFGSPSLDVYALHAYSRHVSPRVRAWIDFLREHFSSQETLVVSPKGHPANSGLG